MRECLRIAAEHDVDVAKVAIHANALRRGDHEISRGSAFFLRPILRIGADVNNLFRIARFIDNLVALVEQVVQIANNCPQILAGRDRAPPADRMETHSDRAFGQQRWRLIRLHCVRMIDAQHKERCSVRRSLAVLARACARGEFVSAEDMFRPEIAATRDRRYRRRVAASGWR